MDPGQIRERLAHRPRIIGRYLDEHLAPDDDSIDGIVGTNTIKALQRMLRGHGYNGPIDGIAGDGTRAAFAKFADVHG